MPATTPATPNTTELVVTGMTCSNCARHVGDAIRSVPGVQSATVSLATEYATVRWAHGVAPAAEAVVKAVAGAGYGARVIQAKTGDETSAAKTLEAPGKTSWLAGWSINLLLGVPVTVALVVGEWVFQLGMTGWFRWLSFGLAALVQIFAGARFYRGAWLQARRGASNMDTLVALGSTAAFAYSVVALFGGRMVHVYFMEAAAIITLVSAGHWLEAGVMTRATSALRQLLELAPPTARRLGPDGSELEVTVGELRPGDRVALRPGDRIPVDGAVAQGESSVDESMLTGESAPVPKKADDLLYAGTINLNGRLEMRVTATGEETALARIAAAVRHAQDSRAEIQRLGDRVSSVFVPIVVLIALAAGLWWGLAPGSARAVHDSLAHVLWHSAPADNTVATAIMIVAGVLIIACPCAMGLATPVAIMAGANAAARRGILIRDGVALEKAGTITTVLLDKTGTLTAGKPTIVERWIAPSQSPEEAVQWATSLARHSTHPISLAVAGLAESSLELSQWEEISGSGITARLADGRKLVLGSLQWLQSSGVELTSGNSFAEEWSAKSATVVGLGAGNVLLALFAAKDALKPKATEVVQRLQASGLKVRMVTGDRASTAAAIARQAGIPPENVTAEVRPESKAKLVAQLQREGERVAFVGDGINDAPALAQADLGIAVTRASDIAREAADIVLVRSDIEAVPESLALAKRTLRTIKQNLFWAFFYNAAGVPLAALGFINPALCAAAMGLSDLVVIGNALRILRRRR